MILGPHIRSYSILSGLLSACLKSRSASFSSLQSGNLILVLAIIHGSSPVAAPTDEPIHSWLLFEKALCYLNQDKPTYVIPRDDAPLWEPSDELVLSKLWPHLDPFGLVDFCVERNLKISLDEQVKHLLNLYDSDFDATLFRQLAFRVPKEKVARIRAALLEIDMDVVTTEAEKHINRILAELQSIGDKIHGITAQMLDMRNEIRGYVSAFGMYILFVTVNLADLHSPGGHVHHASPCRLALKSLPELTSDFGERAMWVPGADDHMRTKTRSDADCVMGDVELMHLHPTPALARSRCLQCSLTFGTFTRLIH
ncbi:BQ5605_C003g02504 [Microbotryum silenes-dioicae]|uniref:BQ5605_C003g02504 protein n=1 Tax=Microbotryum silenes-dioicae TaxID=796604 RepID=A0A2X0M5B8_9BASI|nr:BQ5605_C003g02504 [Microbotryum silenes-dioicae]